MVDAGEWRATWRNRRGRMDLGGMFPPLRAAGIDRASAIELEFGGRRQLGHDIDIRAVNGVAAQHLHGHWSLGILRPAMAVIGDDGAEQ